jgi:hypothetical protein
MLSGAGDSCESEVTSSPDSAFGATPVRTEQRDRPTASRHDGQHGTAHQYASEHRRRTERLHRPGRFQLLVNEQEAGS